MQTFLPHQSFIKSANVLDKKRCWKQVVEAKQILNVLEQIQTGNNKVGWSNHPAVKMWVNYDNALKLYYNTFLSIAISKHQIKTSMQQLDVVTNAIIMPWWMGNKEFHRAMRSRLIEKDMNFYLPKFQNDYKFNDGKYLWPNMVNKTFYII